MSDEQININTTIAEACGWTDISQYTRAVDGWYGYEPENGPHSQVPHYCKDLNAMHEAEKTLSGDQWLDYMLNLQAVLVRHPNRDKWTVCRELRHATARQLAEAFLRTLGKWEE